jgi:small-conductance mechanosensitive channel/CRP-like cAMP-binding protein
LKGAPNVENAGERGLEQMSALLQIMLLSVTVLGIAALRYLPQRVRIAYDAVCFTAISAFFYAHDQWPVFRIAPASFDTLEVANRLLGIVWWLLCARLMVGGFRLAMRSDLTSRQTKLGSDLVAAAVYMAAVLTVIDSVLNLPIKGLLATSGVIAIVIGLALQSTLADVFAGIAVGIEAPFHVGDRIRLDDKIEGAVVQVNWRSIRIHTDDEDIAIIPNSQVAKSQIVNRSSPTERRAADVKVWVPAGADVDQVLELLARATLLCPSILAIPPPTASLLNLGTRAHCYGITFFIAETKHLAQTRSNLLRQVRRHLHFARIPETSAEADGVSTDHRRKLDVARSFRLLRELVLFESLSDEKLESLVTLLKRRTLEPGEVLFTEGSEDATLYIVSAGVLSVSRRGKTGGIELIGRIGVGEYIGEISLLTGSAHVASASAVTRCEIYELSGEAISPMLHEDAELASEFEKSVRHGFDLLRRDSAARVTADIGRGGQLLTKIRKFFNGKRPA